VLISPLKKIKTMQKYLQYMLTTNLDYQPFAALRKCIVQTIIGLCCLILGATTATAKELPKINYFLTGNDFITYNYLTPTPPLPTIGWATYQNNLDVNTFDPATVNIAGEIKTNILTTIELGLNKPDIPLNYNFKLQVKVFIKALHLDANVTSETIDLEMVYHNGTLTRSKIAALHAMKDVYAVDLQVQNVTATGDLGNALLGELSSQVKLEVGFQENRLMAADYNTYPEATHCFNASTQEINISWKGIEAAEGYELEYLFVDNYAENGTLLDPADIAYNFHEQAIRVQTTQPYYRFPHLFERGYILYRVRVVARMGAGLDKPLYCVWSSADNIGNVAAMQIFNYAIELKSHNESMNWQVKTAYAEEGKRSDVAAYYDGTYRARQTVTGYNLPEQVFNGVSVTALWEAACDFAEGTNREIIAGETIYDYQGRPAVNVLPTPTNQLAIAFIPKLNKNAAGNAYTWQDFDKPVTCTDKAATMPHTIGTNGRMGASAYYSNENTNKIGFNAYIPSAEDFPFSQVQYTADNTGKIAAQGGVGKTFQLGNGRETRFLYGATNQDELNRLFGTEVGYYQRYQKNAVIDPNGQVSVSYINPEGKTIATALAGAAPDNLNSLGANDFVALTPSLLGGNTAEPGAATINNSYNFTVTSEDTPYKINYFMNPQSMTTVFCGNTYCLDCIYDIKFELVHNESCETKPLMSYTGTIGDLIKDNLGSSSFVDVFNCDNVGNPFHLEYADANPDMPGVQDEFKLDIGSYSLTKTISVNQAALETYIQTITAERCDAQWQTILDQQWTQVDTTDCHNAAEITKLNKCNVIKNLMLADMSPGGQYAKVYGVRNANGGLYYTTDNPNDNINGEDVTSILGTNILTNTNIYNNILFDGNTMPNATALVQAWKPIWAEQLFQYHPEYCTYGWCVANNVPNPNVPTDDNFLDFTARVQTTDTYAEALAQGLVDNSSTNSQQYLYMLAKDTHLFPLGTVRTAFLARLNNYTSCNSSTGYNIQQTAMLMAYCQEHAPPPPPLTPLNTTINTNQPDCMSAAAAATYLGTHTFYDSNDTPAQRDRKWLMLRTLYIGVREEFMQQSQDAYRGAHDCNTDCIGNPDGFVLPYWFDFPIVYAPPVAPCDFAGMIFFQDKTRRFSGGTQQEVESMLHQANINSSFLDNNNGNNFMNSCQIAQAIADSAVVIGQQAGAFICPTTVTTTPCTTPTPTKFNIAVQTYLNTIFTASPAWAAATPQSLRLSSLPLYLQSRNGMNAVSVSINWLDNPASPSYPDLDVEINYENPTDPNQVQSCRIILMFEANIGNPGGRNANTISGGLQFSPYSGNYNVANATVEYSNNPSVTLAMYPYSDWISCEPMYECITTTSCNETINVPPTYPIGVSPCVLAMTETVLTNTQTIYNDWLTTYTADLRAEYNKKCLQGTTNSPFEPTYSVEYTNKEYHYTLYYYDQAGNLVKTIPPAGFKALVTNDNFAAVNAQRNTGGTSTQIVPAHTLPTVYAYNSLNELLWQRTPDAGLSQFKYDQLGRIAAAQNAQQIQTNTFAYTYYDALGRTVAAGKAEINNGLTFLNLPTADYDNWYKSNGTGYLNSLTRTEITATQYDHAYSPAIAAKFANGEQQNLRKRVASIFAFADNTEQSNGIYTHATHYSYDLLGNVHTLIQDDPTQNGIGDKTVAYDFDLASGKVNRVRYQPDAPDQFTHRYAYDPLNRLIRAQTSPNGVVWETDAEYFYYRHGALARTELGTDKVQGSDYFYTLQGFIKGVNGNSHTAQTDFGGDGNTDGCTEVATGTIKGETTFDCSPDNFGANFATTLNNQGYGALHAPVARDAYGYVLDYYHTATQNDYTAITAIDAVTALDGLHDNSARSLYNGNISRMYTLLAPEHPAIAALPAFSAGSGLGRYTKVLL
jgi:hypothetical protein